MEVFGGDIGRNIFFVSLAERQRQLQEIPWVESATVMRLLPNRLKIQIKERTPVAFVRIGSRASLIDSSGVLLDMPPKPAGRYSFPLITGIAENEPLSSRAAGMKIFTRFMQALDAEGARYSQTISEVDLSDPEDVKATIADSAGAVLVHLGDVQFLERYKLYLAHVEEWRQQYPRLESVDLRYDRQVVLNPDSAQPSAAGVVARSSAAPAKHPAKPPAKTKAHAVSPSRH
ncbi:MAG: cell division protein FtsQ/DivIB [Candidatus Binataceae bacterium]